MEGINPDVAAKLVVTHFLSSLMRIERERHGITRKTASRQAEWTASTWGDIEREARVLQPPHWIKATQVLGLVAIEVVRRLNAFIGKFPNVWLERQPSGQHKYCERPITSPRALRSGKVINVNLNHIRPNLYYELSAFSPNPGEVIEQASNLGFFQTREDPRLQINESRIPADDGASIDTRLERLNIAIQSLPEEKFALLERIVDKFQRYSAKDLGYAYKHFSLSVSKR
ncbi:MAG: helix-turn-helix domain-containing protein [Deltaproteobacteria bacterium]|nr:helix-turn-helix domain-containing protein [Deltaproteobacteria bacterium]